MFGVTEPAQELAERAAALAGDDPAAVASRPEAQLGDEIAALVEARDLLNAALADRLVAFDAQDGHIGEGATNVGQWLGRTCGADPRATSAELTVAKKLSRASVVTDALKSGKLSYAKARVLVRCLTPSPPGSDAEVWLEDAFRNCEAEFVEVARDLSVKGLERFMRRWYLALAPEKGEAEWNHKWAKRQLHHSPSFEGTGILDAGLDPESDAIFSQALDHADEGLRRADLRAAEAAGDRSLIRAPAQRRLDALVQVASGYLAYVNLPTEAGNHRPPIPSLQATFEIDPATLEPTEGAIGDTPVPRKVLERMLCEGRLARLLCTPHHRLMHEGGWSCSIDDDDGRPRFRHPDGRIFHPDPPDPRPPRPPSPNGPAGNNCPTPRG